MYLEIFFETADKAALFNALPVDTFDGDRIVATIDWEPQDMPKLRDFIRTHAEGVIDYELVDGF